MQVEGLLGMHESQRFAYHPMKPHSKDISESIRGHYQEPIGIPGTLSARSELPLIRTPEMWPPPVKPKVRHPL